MKYYLIAALVIWGGTAFAQLSGRITSSQTNKPLVDATVRLIGGGRSVVTNAKGMFSLPAPMGKDTLLIRYVGYITQYIPVDVSMQSSLDIILVLNQNTLEEVEVNTGFYQVPRERATGSFTHIDNRELNRMVGGSILQRLEGIASGVQFTNANGTSASDIRIRGLATLRSDETPLIVIDNFPYEGDINSINPNDVESITILKDASAASIWGARAGNGVIVITTKRGRYGQKPEISINSNVIIGKKPDLFYSQNRLPSEIIMDIERDKYERGGFYLESAQQTPFPQYVELLIARDSGWISETDFLMKEADLRHSEVRDDALKYLYQTSLYEQHSLNARGGSEGHTYYFSAGYDKNRDHVIGNRDDRLNVNLQNAFQPLKSLEMTAGVWYTLQHREDNGLSLGDLASGTSQVGLSPYIRLKDEAGNSLPIVKDYRLRYVERLPDEYLIDWQYRPLDEVALANNRSHSSEIRLNGALRYSFLRHFNVTTTYQYVHSTSESNNLYHQDSYYVRNIVNRFTQEDGSRPIPHAAIFAAGNSIQTASQSGRMQFNYNQSFGQHTVSALGGGDLRQFQGDTFPGYTLYNYDSDLLTGTAYFNYTQNYDNRPTGRGRIPQPSNLRRRFVDRYLSYFGNASYRFKERYTLSASARWDGSNLFGVKTNQKGTPLWSIGGSWEPAREAFYAWGWLPYLRIRATYGRSGNVNKSVSVFPTIVHFGPDWISGLQSAQLTSIGNPSLRWEQVSTVNFGADFRSKNQRVSGSVEFYRKIAKDLIGADRLPPSTGIITGGTAQRTNLINYADLNTKGADLELTTANLRGQVEWRSTLLLNWVNNKVTRFNTGDIDFQSNSWFSGNPPPVVGESRDVVYAQPWHGLDSKTGLPIIYIDGERSTDYSKYYLNMAYGDLLQVGSKIPTVYGSLRNNLRWRGVELDFLISWKGDFVFRRSSMLPGAEYYGTFHMDYFKRWQKPGDELSTNVPNGDREQPLAGSYAYRFTEALITRGDNVRLQDLNINYTFSQKLLKNLPIQSLRLHAYIRNVGILWRANKFDVDPDYPAAEYPAPRTVALGVKIDF